MAVIRPFRLCARPLTRVRSGASVPYDVVNTDEARALAANNPLSFLHVSRPEIDLPDGTDPYSDPVYRKALDNFEKLIKDCPLETENVPSIYLYRLIMGDHEQIGVVACCSIDEYDDGLIRQTRRTRRVKRISHSSHARAARPNAPPVFLAIAPAADIDTW